MKQRFYRFGVGLMLEATGKDRVENAANWLSE